MCLTERTSEYDETNEKMVTSSKGYCLPSTDMVRNITNGAAYSTMATSDYGEFDGALGVDGAVKWDSETVLRGDSSMPMKAYYPIVGDTMEPYDIWKSDFGNPSVWGLGTSTSDWPECKVQEYECMAWVNARRVDNTAVTADLTKAQRIAAASSG